MSYRVPLLSVNKAWEEDRIPDEEDRSVVTNNIPVTIFSIELDSESTGVSVKCLKKIINRKNKRNAII